jgi:phosphoribosylanthranilate isomerase
MTRIKICGLTRPEDVSLASELGASAVGFVFAASSPRRVPLERAEELLAAAGPGVSRVGVFVEEEKSFIEEAIEAARLDLVQLHRPLRAADLEGAPATVIAVVSVSGSAAPLPPADWLRRCRWLLFDAGGSAGTGGAGTRFDWGVLDGKKFEAPVYLAGGLDAGNVGEAIHRVHPDGVDVASGIERAPGVKDPEKMRRFFEAVRAADEKRPREAGGGRREADGPAR